MMLCAARWQSGYHEVEPLFCNRGISGNTLQALKERWERNALVLRPDVVTILVGTNDVSLYPDGKSQLDFSRWEADYRELFSHLWKKNLDLQMILCTPFVAKVGKTGKAEDYARHKALVGQCARVVRKIAFDSGTLLLDYKEMFGSLTQKNPSCWVWDGVHHIAVGNQCMAVLWLSEYALLNGSSSAKEQKQMELNHFFCIRKSAV